jgi:hypothetical protein
VSALSLRAGAFCRNPEPRSLAAKDLCALSLSLFSDDLFKDPENDLSQLNRLGAACQ